MAKTIEVFITETKDGVGQAGQRKNVKLGFFRNYLEPNGYALRISKDNENRFKAIEKKESKRLESIKGSASELQAALSGKKVTIQQRSQQGGKLYGSVTSDIVLAAVKDQLDVDVDPTLIKIKPIKKVGKATVQLAPHPEHIFSIDVIIQGLNDEEETAEAAATEEANAEVAEAAETETAETEVEEVAQRESESTEDAPATEEASAEDSE